MKQLLLLLGCLGGCTAYAQQHRVTRLWETDTVMRIPESVLPDFQKHRLYVSFIDGQGWADDGKGEIALLSADGKIIDTAWVKGLNAPKGLGCFGGLLYVADNSEVVVIHRKTAALVKKISIQGARGLNDIAVDEHSGAVYVSDSRTAKIWKITDGIAELYLDSVKGANGLKCVSDGLLFARGKSLWKADKGRQLSKITALPSGIDGIETVGNGDLLITAWAGYLYYVTKAGAVECLLDTHAEGKNAADLSFDPRKKIIYIPSFNGKTVAAYRLD